MSDELIGKWVTYHGSIEHVHGDYIVKRTHVSYSGDGSTRYILEGYSDSLSNVRRSSFTVIDMETKGL